VATQHSEHLRSGTFDDRYPYQQSWSQVKRQDRLCTCGQILLLLGNDMVEIGDDWQALAPGSSCLPLH
jgi:hypothetical protein